MTAPATNSNSAEPTLLRVSDLRIVFDAGRPTAHAALDGVDLSIAPGEVVGLVGESGSGKTVLSHSIIGLLPRNATVTSGSILWDGKNLLTETESQLRTIRGKEIAMIFQDPQASLNPVYPVGKQIEWVLKLHRNIVGPEAKAEVLRLFEAAKLRDPARCAEAYPHELSGGMCQRVMIAMALACRPKLLIADEPTSALDVTIQSEIVTLLIEIQKQYQMTMLFITHDLGIAARLCQRVIVLQAGKIAEQGLTRDVFMSPKSSYTCKLLDSIFVPDFKFGSHRAELAASV